MREEKEGPAPACTLAGLEDHVAIVLGTQRLSETLKLLSEVLLIHLCKDTHLIESDRSLSRDPLHVKLFLLLLDAL